MAGTLSRTVPEGMANSARPSSESTALLARISLSDAPRQDVESNHEEMRYQECPVKMSKSFFLALTCTNFGMQILWSLLMAYGTPYLNSLGLSGSLTALVWLAGPVSGAVAQPMFGMLSDQCTHPWGRRKPFMISGGAFSVIFLLALASTQDLIDVAAKFMGQKSEEDFIRTVTKALAVLLVWTLNIAMQPLQSGVRAFVIDNCPPHQQSEASAWSSRFSGLGSVSVLALGFTNFAGWVPFFGETDFKRVSVFASIILALCLCISCLLIHEVRLVAEEASQKNKDTFNAFLKKIRRDVTTLPPLTRKVCKIQFFAWLGWFPFLYYTTTYVYEIFMLSEHHLSISSQPDLTDKRLEDTARKSGTFAFFIFALVSFGTSLFLPAFARQRVSQRPDASDAPFFKTSTVFVSVFGIPLPRLWQISHILFACSMFITFFVSSPTVATVFVGTVGISWAVTIWAPFALISNEISHHRKITNGDQRIGLPARHDSDLGLMNEEKDRTAAIMSIHNMAIAVPQIIAAVSCACLFKVLEAIGVENGTAWVMRGAGCAAIVAAWLGRDLRQ